MSGTDILIAAGVMAIVLLVAFFGFKATKLSPPETETAIVEPYVSPVNSKPPATKHTSFGTIALGVFVGLWLYTITAVIVYLLFHAA